MLKLKKAAIRYAAFRYFSCMNLIFIKQSKKSFDSLLPGAAVR